MRIRFVILVFLRLIIIFFENKIRKRRATVVTCILPKATGKWPSLYTSTYSSRLNVNLYASCSHSEYLPVFLEERARAKSSFIHRKYERECDAHFVWFSNNKMFVSFPCWECLAGRGYRSPLSLCTVCFLLLAVLNEYFL